MGKNKEVRAVARRPYWREAEARVMVEGWQGSGEELGEFARGHGVEPARLKRWAKRLGGVLEQEVRFHPARLVGEGGEERAGGRIEMQLPGGLRILLPEGFEAEDLRRVLEVIGETARC